MFHENVPHSPRGNKAQKTGRETFKKIKPTARSSMILIYISYIDIDIDIYSYIHMYIFIYIYTYTHVVIYPFHIPIVSSSFSFFAPKATPKGRLKALLFGAFASVFTGGSSL